MWCHFDVLPLVWRQAQAIFSLFQTRLCLILVPPTFRSNWWCTASLGDCISPPRPSCTTHTRTAVSTCLNATLPSWLL